MDKQQNNRYAMQNVPQTQFQSSQSQPQPIVQQPSPQPVMNQPQPVRTYETIYCSTCGQQIAKVALACPFCGAPVYQNQPQQQSQQPQQIIINNSNNNANVNTIRGGGFYAVPAGQPKNKWIALLLLIFLGGFGAHKFYEGKILMGIVYIFTVGFFGIGWIVDFFALLFKPNPYYV